MLRSKTKYCSLILAFAAGCYGDGGISPVDEKQGSDLPGDVSGGGAGPGGDIIGGGGGGSGGGGGRSNAGGGSGNRPGPGDGGPDQTTPIAAVVSCRDPNNQVIANGACDPVDGLCKDAAGQPIAGATCVESATICVDATGAPVPGATCGADNLCRDNAGNIIEGTC